MVGKRKHPQELDAPPIASANDKSMEVLRVWAAPGGHQQVSLRTTWADAGAWGLLLVDVARHASRAYEQEGLDANEVLARIRELFDAEWSSPTDAPENITEKA